MYVSICISDQIVFNLKKVIKDTDGHYLLLRRTIYHEILNLINLYSSNVGSALFERLLLTNLKETHK